MQLWLDATDVDGDGQIDSLSDDSNLSVWVDKAGGDHNATQSDINKRPSYKTNSINGHASIHFNNSEWFSFNEISDIRTVFWVVTNNGGTQPMLGHSQSYHFHPDGSKFWSNQYASTFIKNGKTYLRGTEIDDSQTIRPIGSFIASLITTGDVEANRLNKDRGAGNNWNGKIGEILIFNEGLSEENMKKVGQYLSTKWNLVYSPNYAINSSTTDLGRAYLLNLMNLREASPAEVTRAKEGATSGTVNAFSPTFKVGPGERPNKINEYGFDTGETDGFWVVPQ